MLSIPADVKVYVFSKSVDFRKGFEGLSCLVEQHFPGQLLSFAFFAFFNKSRCGIKVLYWDNDGLAIWYKRLEKGSFPKGLEKESLDRKSFLMLLEGVIPQKIQKRFSL